MINLFYCLGGLTGLIFTWCCYLKFKRHSEIKEQTEQAKQSLLLKIRDNTEQILSKMG